MIRSVPLASTVLASSAANSCILLLARPALRPDPTHVAVMHVRVGLQLVRARPPAAQSWGTQLEMERAFFSPAAKGRRRGITSSPSLRVTYPPEQNPRDAPSMRPDHHHRPHHLQHCHQLPPSCPTPTAGRTPWNLDFLQLSAIQTGTRTRPPP